MIGYVTIGADNLRQAERFYSSFLLKLGFVLETSDSDGAHYLTYKLAGPIDRQGGPAHVEIVPPFDGRPATVGNGMMVAFQVPTQSQVRALHAAALDAGGRDVGAPGFRAAYSDRFYVGYLRDPQGNRIALFCNNPSEPERPSASTSASG